MSGNKTRTDKVQPITTKDIRNQNDEFLLSKGIKPPEPQNKKEEATKPRRAPGAPSPEPVKKKKKPKKKKDDKSKTMPTY